MKKALAVIALAAICFSTSVYAVTPVKAAQDTTTTKMKVKKKGNKMKMKKKTKDTTSKM